MVAQSPLDDNLAGRIDHYNQTIRLLDVGTDYKERTYLHEILHGIDRYTNSELSEAQVEQISSGLFAWLVENGLQITGKE